MSQKNATLTVHQTFYLDFYDEGVSMMLFLVHDKSIINNIEIHSWHYIAHDTMALCAKREHH